MGLRAASASVTDRQPRLTGAPTRATTGNDTAMDRHDPPSTSHDTTTDGPVRYAGVDWSWFDHAVCIIDETGTAIEQITVKHSAAGLGKLATLPHPLGATWCPYVARQVAVKAKYGLWVTQAERDAITRLLGDCPREPLPA
jgi:hypothetical protein